MSIFSKDEGSGSVLTSPSVSASETVPAPVRMREHQQLLQINNIVAGVIAEDELVMSSRPIS